MPAIENNDAGPSNHKKIPSTPNTNGIHVNGNGPHNSRKGKWSLQNGSAQKRPATAYMDDDDDMFSSPTRRMSNGHVNGANSPHKKQRKNGINRPSLQEQREALPIWKGKETLVQEIRANDTVVILGETGSGKTTQVPQFLLESDSFGGGIIAITQPRKVAATSLADRVAKEQNVELGTRVGYSVRFDDNTSPETRIKYLTDGMLVRELLTDELLTKYSVVIIDEAHERTLRTDLLLSSLKTIQKRRNTKSETTGSKFQPLKVVVMSATLDAKRFSKFFNNAKILYVEGRQHAVKVLFAEEPQVDYVDSALKTFFQIHKDKPSGDVLVFLPGQEDIEALAQSIRTYASKLPEDSMKVAVFPMYAALSQQKQNDVFRTVPSHIRKCILSTNIAETSITIPGIKYVIDTGVCKEKSYHAPFKGTGIDALTVKPISKSSALQRSGRAGREGPGECYRLYTEDTFNRLRESAIPEIQRTNLAFAVLQLKCMGFDPATTEFMDPPNPDIVMSSLISLHGLQALDNAGKVTPLGKRMTQFPLDPPLSSALLASQTHHCTSEVISIVSLLSASSQVFVEPSPSSDQRSLAQEARAKFRHSSGDHLTLLNLQVAYQELSEGTKEKGATRDWCQRHFVNERALKEAMEIAKQLRVSCERAGLDWKTSCGDNTDLVLKSLLTGLYQNTAILQPDGGYRQTLGHTYVKMHPSSTMIGRKVRAIMYDELVLTSGTYARGVSSIHETWLTEIPFFARARTA